MLLRMSSAQKHELEERAAAAGMTQRAYVLWKTLGVDELEQGKPGRPRVNCQDPLVPLSNHSGEGLRMTG